MNALMNVSEVQTMSSREIAELTGKSTTMCGATY